MPLGRRGVARIHALCELGRYHALVLRGLKNRRRYVGINKELARRLEEHRAGTSKGSQLIGQFELILTEEYSTYSAARDREKFLKSGQGRQWLNEIFGR